MCPLAGTLQQQLKARGQRADSRISPGGVSPCRHPTEDALRVEWIFQDAAKRKITLLSIEDKRARSGHGASQGQAGEELAVCFQLIGKGDLSQISDFMATIYSALVPVYQHLHLLSAQAAALT